MGCMVVLDVIDVHVPKNYVGMTADSHGAASDAAAKAVTASASNPVAANK